MTTNPTPDFTSPLAGRIEVREPCPWCPDRPMVPRSLMDDHCAQLHPDVQAASAVVAVAVPPTGQTALRDRIAEAVQRQAETGNVRYEAIADAVLAVLPPPADRAAVLVEEALLIERHCPDHSPQDQDGVWMDCHCAVAEDMRKRAADLRRLADEAQQQPETQAAEDPARIDRIRPEFTDHASVESIDAQLRRARAQERRWHLRTEWLISLRSARVEQKARGEWPADGRCAACGHSVCDGEAPCGARSGDDFCTRPGPAAVSAVPPQPEEA